MNELNHEHIQLGKLGKIYFNQNDPQILVRKRNGSGRTLNFGHPISLFVMIWILILAIAAVLISFDVVAI